MNQSYARSVFRAAKHNIRTGCTLAMAMYFLPTVLATSNQVNADNDRERAKSILTLVSHRLVYKDVLSHELQRALKDEGKKNEIRAMISNVEKQVCLRPVAIYIRHDYKESKEYELEPVSGRFYIWILRTMLRKNKIPLETLETILEKYKNLEKDELKDLDTRKLGLDELIGFEYIKSLPRMYENIKKRAEQKRKEEEKCAAKAIEGLVKNRQRQRNREIAKERGKEPVGWLETFLCLCCCVPPLPRIEPETQDPAAEEKNNDDDHDKLIQSESETNGTNWFTSLFSGCLPARWFGSKSSDKPSNDDADDKLIEENETCGFWNLFSGCCFEQREASDKASDDDATFMTKCWKYFCCCEPNTDPKQTEKHVQDKNQDKNEPGCWTICCRDCECECV